MIKRKKWFVNDIILLLALVYNLPALAANYDYTCHPSGAEQDFNESLGTLTVTDASKNKAGEEFVNALAWDAGQSATVACNCNAQNGGYTEYFSALSDLPVANVSGSSGVGTYYKINEYIAVAAQIFIAQGFNNYRAAPFTNADTYTHQGYQEGYINSGESKTITTDTGSKGKLSLYIMKPFTGRVDFNARTFELYMTTAPNSGGTPPDPKQGAPYAVVMIGGSIVVPQSCQINSGQTLNVNLGNIYSGEFTIKGQIPRAFSPKVVSIPVHCTDMDGVANVQLTMTGASDANVTNAIATNNPDVAVDIMDQNNNVITPNSNIGMLFTLDSNDDATLTLHVAPVSATGNPPAGGTFSALAYLRVDFE